MQNQITNLFSQLQEWGVEIYGTPLWEYVETKMPELVIDGTNVVLAESERYPGVMQIVIRNANQVAYIQVRGNVKPDTTKVTLNMYQATRDWEEYGIKKGMYKLFAE